MKVVSADFAVSDPIWKGIASGAYERVGGVIRDAHSKKVVAWLHEIGSPKAAVFNPAIIGSSVLSLGVSAIGFALVLDRLNTIQNNLKAVEASIKRVENRIDMAAYADFESAVNLANMAMRSENPEHRTHRAHDAAKKFLEVEALYKSCAASALEVGNSFSYDYIQILHLSYVAAARCFLELDDMKEAIYHLKEGETVLRPLVEKYVSIMLTSNPAIYLHPKLKDQIDLVRLTKIVRWQDPRANENSVFERCRQGLHGLSGVGHSEWGKRLPDALWDTDKVAPRSKITFGGYINDEIYDHLPSSIKRIETLIETFQRLNGYFHELEIYQRNAISFNRWEKTVQQLETSGDTLKLSFLIPSFSQEYEAHAKLGKELAL